MVCTNAESFNSAISLTTLSGFSRRIRISFVGSKYYTGWGYQECHGRPYMSCYSSFGCFALK